MQSLLKWSIENSTGAPVQPRSDIDPGIIDHILGKPDAQLMREALDIAVDETKDEDERVAALDDFEMLIEQIDNANNIEKLGMWESIQKLITSPNSPPSIKTHALWIIGTALQNNPAAQQSYLDHSKHSLPLIVGQLSSETDKTRSKALYALSGLLKHNASAVEKLDKDAWETITRALSDRDPSVRRKIPFLLNSLITPTGTTHHSSLPSNVHTEPKQPPHPNSHASHVANPESVNTSPATLEAMREHGVIGKVTGLLGSSKDDEWNERAARLLHTYTIPCEGPLSEQEMAEIGDWLDANENKSGLDKSEEQELKQKLKR